MAPGGANLMGSTSIFLPSLLLWPVTAIGGPVLSYDVLATVGLALSAWTAYFAMLRLTPYSSTAWMGGAIYGFGGYMAGQATAHANLLIAVFPPLAAMLLDDVRTARGPARVGALLGLCAAAQVFVNEEILASTAIMALAALVLVVLLSPPTRAMVGGYARAGAAAAVVFAVLAGPALGYQLFGPEHVSGTIVSPGRYVNDLAGFVVPSSIDWLSTEGSRHLASGFSGMDGELGSYLGVPLLAVIVLAGRRLRRRALLLMLLLATATVFSLGPHLRVLGHDTGIWLPWILPNHMPLLENVIPSRFNLFIWLASGALVVLLVDDLRRRPLLGRRGLGLALCGLALMAVIPTLTPSEVARVPAVIADAAVLHAFAPAARTVLIVPSANGQLGMYAQARADFAYDIPDGGVFVPSPDGPSYGMRHGPLLYALATLGGHASTRAGRTHVDALCLERLAIGATPGGGCKAHYLRALLVLRVDAVIVNLGSRSSAVRYTRFFRTLLGPPTPAADAEVFPVAGARQ